VQSTVNDDPRSLAEAYNSAPPYPGLTAGQIRSFRERLTTDAGFSARLNKQLGTACKPGGSAEAQGAGERDGG
jgi:hypothetical protein